MGRGPKAGIPSVQAELTSAPSRRASGSTANSDPLLRRARELRDSLRAGPSGGKVLACEYWALGAAGSLDPISFAGSSGMGTTFAFCIASAAGRRENLVALEDHIEIVEGDIQSYECAHTSVGGCEVVLHRAALPSVPRSVQDPLTPRVAKVEGTLNVLLPARDSGVRRVVFASSSSVYGATPTLPKVESAMPEPIFPYAVTKLAGEGYCRTFSRVDGPEAVALRYFNGFGARQDPLSQDAAVVPNFITALLADRRVTVYGDGRQSRDFSMSRTWLTRMSGRRWQKASPVRSTTSRAERR
jgi:hypothetical protein